MFPARARNQTTQTRSDCTSHEGMSVIRQYKLLWQVSSVKLLVSSYLLSSLVPSVGCSGSSNDLSKDSSRASLISDLEQDIWKSIPWVYDMGISSCFINFVRHAINCVSSNTVHITDSPSFQNKGLCTWSGIEVVLGRNGKKVLFEGLKNMNKNTYK